MNIDAVVHHLETNDFFSSGVGFPVHTSGLYCIYRKQVSLMAASSQIVIQFERMDFNDTRLYEKYDELFHITAYRNDIQIHDSTSETMTPQEMESLVRNILQQLESPEFTDVSFA